VIYLAKAIWNEFFSKSSPHRDIMLTQEGADSDETIVRPISSGGWRIEFPTHAGISFAFARSESEALILARHLRPDAAIRILPARESQSYEEQGND
jgi:hypothetical protein